MLAAVPLAALGLALAFATPARAEPLQLTQADSGKSFALHSGDEVEVRLSENASTGYVWSQQAATGLKPVGRDSEYPNNAGMVGVPGTAVFRYRAQAEGAAALTLKLARGWEPAPIQTFSVQFVIR